jgi:hypothetical protein
MEGKLLRTGAMVGLRNSMRAVLARAPMHGTLWLNDPDCVVVRRTDTKMSDAERLAQVHAIAVSGGLVMVSDEWSRLEPPELEELRRLLAVSGDCFGGRASALDLMERELPEQFHNDAGYLAVFNWEGPASRKRYDLARFRAREPRARALVDVESGARIEPVPAWLDAGPMPVRGSRLFRVERA